MKRYNENCKGSHFIFYFICAIIILNKHCAIIFQGSVKMEYKFSMHGTCAKQVSFELDGNNHITNVKFIGGCSGNAKGIAALAENRTPEEVITSLNGIKCGYKNTSCPDQFAQAL